MRLLTRFECKKSFLSVKNLLLLLLLLVTIAYPLVDGAMKTWEANGKRFGGYSSISSAGWGSEDWGAAIRMSQLLNLYPDPLTRPEEVEAELDVWRMDSHYSAARRVYMRWLGEDRWRDAVQAAVDQDVNVRDAMAAGVIDARLGGNAETLQELDNRIRKNQYLLDHDVRIITEDTAMTGWAFLRRVLDTLLPVLFTAAVVAAAADVVAAERDTGSFKFLLLQPIPRRNIFTAKLGVSFMHTLCLVFVPFALAFCASTLLFGTGSGDYPMAYCADSYVSFINSGYNVQAVEYIATADWFVQLLPLMLCWLLFLTAFAVFVSTAAKTSVTALTVTLTTTLAASVMQPYLTGIPGFSAIWPFSYADPMAVLSGELQTTALCGIVVLLGFSAALITASFVMFCREDVTC